MKTIITLLAVVFATALFGETINVPSAGYATIQDAIEYTQIQTQYSEITIVVADSAIPYSENLSINFTNTSLTDLTLESESGNYENCTIDGTNTEYLPVIGIQGDYTEFIITGFTLINGNDGINLDNFAGQPSTEIINCKIINNDYCGIYCLQSNIKVTDCIITSNNQAISFANGYPSFYEDSEVNNTLIYNNGIGLSGFQEADYYFNNCTIVDNTDCNLDIDSGGEISNCIIWNMTGSEDFPNVDISYSCIEGILQPGEGNINQDPLFVDPLNGDYQLTQLSPCIDTGDPTSPLDPDGSLADMGCYPYLHDYDTKHFTPGWQWSSFPVLTNDGMYSGTHNPLTGELYQQAYWNSIELTPGLLQESATSTGTIDGFVEIQGNRGNDIFLIPDVYNYAAGDDGFENELYRTKGYKIFIEGTNPTTLIVDGDRLPANHTIDGVMNSGEYHWLCFWVPRTQSMIESFGDGVDGFWQYVEKVKSEDWFYSPANNQRGGDPTYPVAISAEGLTLEYGKAYLVLFNEQVEGFHWTDTSITVETEKKSEPENFTYTEKADYEAVDVFNIPPNVTEIGVFEDEVCVGAVVVEDTCAQILVYSDNANRDPVPFTFEVVTGRGFSTPIKDYQVLDWETGKFESKSIISGRQEYSVIRFGDEDEPEDNILLTPQLYGNYPNPFNPTTTISFSLPDEQEIDLTIYNIKGQKVKRLIKGQLTAGQHSMIWDGKDTNEKSVGTGIYFYKLKTGNDVLTRKMLMLK
ncbi:MAG: T9SS type A sorting domain-containing protein [Saprospiraceae bacterium]|nr:T9SS type A sorting domain-containing protein [Saprospiraceae bacterium]